MRNGEGKLEYCKLDKRAVKSWRIGRLIAFLILLLITVPLGLFLGFSDWHSAWKLILIGAMTLLDIYLFLGLLLYPELEYRQWGYIVEEDRVVIRHGIFFVKKVIIPIIRIQNITVSQGPINRKLGIYSLEMSLASGSFAIEGLNKETADFISENLKAKLYERLQKKGEI